LWFYIIIGMGKNVRYNIHIVILEELNYIMYEYDFWELSMTS